MCFAKVKIGIRRLALFEDFAFLRQQRLEKLFSGESFQEKIQRKKLSIVERIT